MVKNNEANTTNTLLLIYIKIVTAFIHGTYIDIFDLKYFCLMTIMIFNRKRTSNFVLFVGSS